MNSNSVHRKKEEKFLFNTHNFDEEDVEEEIEVVEEEPPPPMFSEAELEAAKKKAFDAGKNEGLQESKASRAEKATNLLEVIAADFKILFEAEDRREKTYERESVNLSLNIFRKLFPAYYERHGMDELKKGITEILQKHAGQKRISIAVAPEVQPAIENLLESLSKTESLLAFDIKADDKLRPQACKLAWEDGGAIKDTESLAQEIETILQQVLAASPANRHDSDETEESRPPEEAKPEAHVDIQEDSHENSQVVEKPDE